MLEQIALRSLIVHQLGQTRILEVLFTSADPKFAADFVNTLTTEYVDSNMEARWKMSERTGVWLNGQLDDMRIKLERSEAALQQYAQRSGLLYTTPQSGGNEKTNVSEDKLRQLQESLSHAEADRAAAQSRYEIAKAAPPESVGDVLNDESLRELQGKLTDLKRQEAALIAVYTPKHEKVKQVEAQIAPLQSAFDANAPPSSPTSAMTTIQPCAAKNFSQLITVLNPLWLPTRPASRFSTTSSSVKWIPTASCMSPPCSR